MKLRWQVIRIGEEGEPLACVRVHVRLAQLWQGLDGPPASPEFNTHSFDQWHGEAVEPKGGSNGDLCGIT